MRTLVLPLPPGLPPPDADRLLVILRGCLDDGDLWLIAEADRGSGAEQHERMLRSHLDEGWPRLDWHPREALQLTSWDGSPHGIKFERRHWRRAFCCAALLRAFGEPANRDHLWGQNGSLAILIDSLVALADMPLAMPRRELVAGLARPAAASLVWLIPSLSSDEADEAAFFGLGLLWFALVLDVPDATLLALAEWIMIVEDGAGLWPDEVNRWMPRRWLFGATCYNLQLELWRDIDRRLPGRLAKRHGPTVVEAVGLIAAMIADERGA